LTGVRGFRHAGSGQEQIDERDQGGGGADQDQGVIGSEVVLHVKRWSLWGHLRGLGDKAASLCEVVHIRSNFFPARSPERVSASAVGSAVLGQEQAMAQGFQSWRSGKGERQWLSRLIDTMEQIARPDVRGRPVDRLVLARVRAQLGRPASHPYAARGLRH